MSQKIEKIINEISFQKNENYFKEIYPNIWIMDNHKWALYCWEQYRIKNQIPSTLVHLDYHWDAINNYFEDESLVKNMDLKALYNEIKNNIIRCDSFITPAIIRDYIDKVVFHCFQTDTIGFDGDFIKRYNTTQNIHNNIEDLVNEIEKQEIILDIDLDIFNTLGMSMGSVWCKEEIKTYINKINPLIKQAKIITIAMSYGYTGSSEEIEYLTKLVIPLIIETRIITQEEKSTKDK
jgi:hypothetical protein